VHEYSEEQAVKNRKTKPGVIIGATSFLFANSAFAFDMGNMMNPSKWMGGDDDHDDYYGGPGYGYGGYPGYGPGYGYGGYPGYGAPGYGYGAQGGEAAPAPTPQ